MTDAATKPLQLRGDSAAACIGDVCEVPEHYSQAIVNRRLDEDTV